MRRGCRPPTRRARSATRATRVAVRGHHLANRIHGASVERGSRRIAATRTPTPNNVLNA